MAGRADRGLSVGYPPDRVSEQVIVADRARCDVREVDWG